MRQREWTSCDMPWREFERQHQGDLVGLEIILLETGTDGLETARYVIGSINDNGGLCDCCSIGLGWKVISWRRVFDYKEEEK